MAFEKRTPKEVIEELHREFNEAAAKLRKEVMNMAASEGKAVEREAEERIRQLALKYLKIMEEEVSPLVEKAVKETASKYGIGGPSESSEGKNPGNPGNPGNPSLAGAAAIAETAKGIVDLIEEFWDVLKKLWNAIKGVFG